MKKDVAVQANSPMGTGSESRLGRHSAIPPKRLCRRFAVRYFYRQSGAGTFSDDVPAGRSVDRSRLFDAEHRR